LIASSILDEGADVPEIDTVVIASAGKSAIKGIQRIGRGMRRMAGKELVVYDFVDRHAPVLLRHSKMRKRVYQQFSSTKAEIWKL
jgi:superfamily II DNA or RNA helicase